MRDKILQLRSEGKTYAEIKVLVGCSKSTVCYHCGVGQKEKNNERVKNRRAQGFEPKRRGNVCRQCGEVTVKRNRIYCSDSCRESRKKEMLKAGVLIKNHTIKGWLIKIHGAICVKCGQSEIWNGKHLALQVDHIDGDSDNCKSDNLRLLCPNCHSQTETFCGGKKNKKYTKRNKYLRKIKGYVD